jgi:ABC-type multidrug transport system ATPase subunit
MERFKRAGPGFWSFFSVAFAVHAGFPWGVLRLDSIGVEVPGVGSPLLTQIHLHLPGSHFGAIVGPSGCGKSTLLKVIAGILPHTEGKITWRGRDLEKEDLAPGEIGYVPQFTCAQPRLTVRENLRYTARLRSSAPRAELEEIVERVEEQAGLADLQDRRAGVLSGGQLRRLGLAMELTTRPSLLLADEVTSGLDPKSEEEITALLANLAREQGRLVLLVTHSLRFLNRYDSVTVLTGGRLAYAAQPSGLAEYFQVDSPEEVYPALAGRESSQWAEEWVASPAELGFEVEAEVENLAEQLLEPPPPVSPDLPGFLTQGLTWAERRMRIFMRDPAQFFLQLALLLVFPAVVAVFAYRGLPAVRNMTMAADTNILQQLQESLAFTVQSSRVGTLVSGLAMFQVILLALMGSNNSAREVVGERAILEKEKLAGLRPGAALLGMVMFLSLLVLVQSAWMTLFVRAVCQFPGDLTPQFLPFFLVTAAMTSLCLAISSWSSTSEQASLGSLYLVGFQLPLSGAILALPEVLGWITRPLISAYWAWCGYLQTLRDTRFYDLVRAITETPLAQGGLSLWMLCLHVGAGLIFAYLGIRRAGWRS